MNIPKLDLNKIDFINNKRFLLSYITEFICSIVTILILGKIGLTFFKVKKFTLYTFLTLIEIQILRINFYLSNGLSKHLLGNFIKLSITWNLAIYFITFWYLFTILLIFLMINSNIDY